MGGSKSVCNSIVYTFNPISPFSTVGTQFSTSASLVFQLLFCCGSFLGPLGCEAILFISLRQEIGAVGRKELITRA